MKQIVSFIGKCLMVLGGIPFIAEADTPGIALNKTVIAVAAIGIGYLMARKDLRNADGRA